MAGKKDAVSAAEKALTAAIHELADNSVADEIQALAAMTVALAQRIGRCAKSAEHARLGVRTTADSMEVVAVEAFEEQSRGPS